MNLFEGVRVIDITNNLAGPGASALMADYGADVIKIEKPVLGDDCRFFPSFVDGLSLSHCWVNRGKKSVVLNLKDPVSVEIVKKMAKEADVLIESNRPGVMKRLGLDYDTLKEINPGLIYCSVSAFGQKGPYSKRPGYDIIAQGYSGIMEMTGDPAGPPTRIGISLGDYVAAINTFGSVSAALFMRERTGEGQHVDISLARGLLWMTAVFPQFNIPGPAGEKYKNAPMRFGNHDYQLCPYGVFSGKDGQNIIIGAVNANTWNSLCKAMGKEELALDPRYISNNKRIERKQEVIDIIEGWLKTFDDIRDAEKILLDSGVPCIKVYNMEDLYYDPQANECKWLVDLPVMDGITSIEKFRARANLADFSKAAPHHSKAPTLGQHNHEILRQYGLTDEEIDECEAKWEAEVKAKLRMK